MPVSRTSVSVIIPAYNEASRIARTIESVLAQTFQASEILIIDDGSKDETAAVAEAFPVRVIRQENRGISAARNRGFREATGEWLALLDADDLWKPARLEWLARATDARPDIGFGFSDYVVEEAGVPSAPSALGATEQFCVAPKTPVADGVATIERSALCAALAVGNFLGTSTIFVRRELILRHALWFDETLPLRAVDYQLSEDVEWYLRVLKWSDALAVAPVLASYIRHPNSQAEAYGRVRFGDVKLGDRIAARPDEYGPGSSSAFAKMRRLHQRHAAALHMREANFAAARSILSEAQAEHFIVRDAVSLAAAVAADCRVGRTLTLAARSMWRQALRPIVRSLRVRRDRA